MSFANLSNVTCEFFLILYIDFPNSLLLTFCFLTKQGPHRLYELQFPQNQDVLYASQKPRDFSAACFLLRKKKKRHLLGISLRVTNSFSNQTTQLYKWGGSDPKGRAPARSHPLRTDCTRVPSDPAPAGHRELRQRTAGPGPLGTAPALREERGPEGNRVRLGVGRSKAAGMLGGAVVEERSPPTTPGLGAGQQAAAPLRELYRLLSGGSSGVGERRSEVSRKSIRGRRLSPPRRRSRRRWRRC